jgi:hypothetical protein
MSPELHAPEGSAVDPEEQLPSPKPASRVRALLSGAASNLRARPTLSIGIAAAALVLLVGAAVVTGLVLQQQHLVEARAELQSLVSQESTAQDDLLQAKATAGDLIAATTDPATLDDPSLLDALQTALDATADPIATELPPLETVSDDSDFEEHRTALEESIASTIDATAQLVQATDAVNASIITKAKSILDASINAGEEVYVRTEGKVDDSLRAALRVSIDAAKIASADAAATAAELADAKSDVDEKTAAVQAAEIPTFESMFGDYSNGRYTFTVTATRVALSDCENCDYEGYREVTSVSWDGTCYAVAGDFVSVDGSRQPGEQTQLCPKGRGGPGDDTKDRLLFSGGTYTYYRPS